jgi:hypothetical protein
MGGYTMLAGTNNLDLISSILHLAPTRILVLTAHILIDDGNSSIGIEYQATTTEH